MLSQRSRRMAGLATAFALTAGLVLASDPVPLSALGSSEAPPPSAGVPAPAAVQRAYPGVPAPALNVQSALLMDADSGLVLYSYAADRPEPPASLTKMMTVNLALEALRKGSIRADAHVPVSEKAWHLALDTQVSRMFIEPRLPVTVDQLLYGIMVSSGNDAAVALAEYLANGSEDAFVDRMNAEARRLGMDHTHFADAAGLAEGGVTTAADMAALARHLLLDHPEVLKYSSTKTFEYNIKRPQRNYNSLLFTDPRVDGLKTGNIDGLFHLVATGKVGGMRLIAVVMGTASEATRASQAEMLLDWGFRSFQAETASGRAAIPVYKGAAREVPVHFTTRVVEPKDLQAAGVKKSRSQHLPPYVVAPVRQGEKLGTVSIRVGELAFEFAVTADRSVPRGGLARVAWDSIRLFFHNLIHLRR